jgi:hypothetical protein
MQMLHKTMTSQRSRLVPVCCIITLDDPPQRSQGNDGYYRFFIGLPTQKYCWVPNPVDHGPQKLSSSINDLL